MIEQTKTAEQLRHEINMLRRENRELTAQLALHRRMVREVNLALVDADERALPIQSRGEAVARVLEENQALNNQLKVFRLTEREREVLRLIVQGLTSKEIADHLAISKLTVDTHRKHIQQKLGVTKQMDLLKLAMQTGIS